MNSRAAVAGIVAEWLETGKFPDRMVDEVSSDKAFVMEAVYGVARRRRTLDWAIARLSSAGRADKKVVPFLLTGLYQILFMSDIQPYAAVNETVEACGQGASRRAAGFVNAILRRACREKSELWDLIAGLPLDIRESHPPVLVKRWQARFGDEKTARLCEWNNTKPGISLRLNLARTSMTDFVKMVRDAGLYGTPHPYAPDQCMTLSHGASVAGVPGYNEGLFMVQDPSMILPVRLLSPKSGETVLDACSAPGGKTAHMAEMMFGAGAGSGALVAADLHEDRLGRVRENVARMGCARVEVCCADMSRPEGKLGEMRFDAILVDAPCTNTGVLRRRPDARWRFSVARMKKMCEIQKAILDGTARLLKPGGRMVYCTCSLENEEGEILLAEWLARNGAFEIVEQHRLFPPDTDTDGVFAALLLRRSEIA